MRTSDQELAKKLHLVYDENPTLNEKVDVYSLGNILYRILTGGAPRGKSIPERILEVREELIRGQFPPLKEIYRNSKDPNVLAIKEAMVMCHEPNPNKRSTAREVAQFLE